MTNLHVVYRVHDSGTRSEQWSSYSFPYSVYVEGSTLEEARSELFEALKSAPPDICELDMLEHLEHPLVPGSYVRTAVDLRTLDREATAQTIRSSLALPSQFDDFRRKMPTAATGDAVMIACVPQDTLSWVFEQMTDHDAVGICALGPEAGTSRLVWWSFIVGGKADDMSTTVLETLGSAGLSGASTIAEFMSASSTSTGRRVLAQAG